MNCLIILLLLACGGCQNGWGGCGCARSNDNVCCRNDRDCCGDCACRGDSRSSERCPGVPERDECDHRHGGPAAWNEGREGRHNSYPSISSDESCGCDAE
ncbi:MAG: hypothetical protein K2O34_03220 [Acetatifactor sp.]|nr:hypothetical protein [Acetatifactor sp.]